MSQGTYKEDFYTKLFAEASEGQVLEDELDLPKPRMTARVTPPTPEETHNIQRAKKNKPCRPDEITTFMLLTSKTPQQKLHLQSCHL